MSHILRDGQSVDLRLSEATCTVKRYLGRGRRGEVYQADFYGSPLALQWFHSQYAQQDPRLHERLDVLIEAGRPSDRFLWPEETATVPDVDAFGYVMVLREARFKGVVDLVKRRVQPTFRALTTAGFELATGFGQLHDKGFCYRNITIGTVFLDPATGELRIGDNDNVEIQAMSTGAEEILDFMAPELVLSGGMLSVQTDLYSLSLLLFYLLLHHHPLVGKREATLPLLDRIARVKLLGKEPLFIFDPHDHSNELQLGYQDDDRTILLWKLYPLFLRTLFTDAFTRGLHDSRNGRVTETQWQSVMVRLRDAIFHCSSCGSENFYDAEVLKQSDGQPGACQSCGVNLRLPPRIRIGSDIVMLNPDTRLYAHHVDETAYDFSRPVAEVARHPNDPTILGLKNVSLGKWISTSSGAVQEVLPGRSVTLAAGTRIHFGKVEGEIRI